MISFTVILHRLRLQVHFSDLVDIQKAIFFLSIVCKVFLDFLETSFVVKLYFYNRCTGNTIAFHRSELE